MTDDFQTLYDYNRWANRKVLDACRQLTAEQYAAEPAPGWSSIRSTVTHIAITTEGWLRGLAGENAETFPTEADLPTLDDAEALLDRAHEMALGVIAFHSPETLASPQTLRGRGRTISVPPWAVLRHLVNHATYHRGQVASKLKRFGIEAPASDLIFYVLEHQGR